jgi:hypothetical protein
MMEPEAPMFLHFNRKSFLYVAENAHQNPFFLIFPQGNGVLKLSVRKGSSGDEFPSKCMYHMGDDYYLGLISRRPVFTSREPSNYQRK